MDVTRPQLLVALRHCVDAKHLDFCITNGWDGKESGRSAYAVLADILCCSQRTKIRFRVAPDGSFAKGYAWQLPYGLSRWIF
jgi:hypothetical protein